MVDNIKTTQWRARFVNLRSGEPSPEEAKQRDFDRRKETFLAEIALRMSDVGGFKMDPPNAEGYVIFTMPDTVPVKAMFQIIVSEATEQHGVEAR